MTRHAYQVRAGTISRGRLIRAVDMIGRAVPRAVPRAMDMIGCPISGVRGLLSPGCMMHVLMGRMAGRGCFSDGRQ